MKALHPRALIPWLLACVPAFASLGCMQAPGKPGPQPEVGRPDQLLDLATLYQENCAACHGEHGKNGPAISLANPVYLAFAGTQNIERVTQQGVPGTAMPPFAKESGGTLTDRQIAVLASGMVSAWGDRTAIAATTPPAYAGSAAGNPLQGEKTFALFCARCHGVDGTGTRLANGIVTGSLIDPTYLALVSDQGLRSIVVAGQTDAGAHDWRSYITASGARPISDGEIADVVAWLASHRIAAPGQVYRDQP
jgi:cytochrome c oxidase cbb3-type subunit 3/ubiquinol-cytochrome c reductase cytochrome c subunit